MTNLENILIASLIKSNCYDMNTHTTRCNLFSKYLQHSILDLTTVVCWVELNWLFNVTINDISVIYVTAQICAGGVEPTVGLPTP